MAEERNAQEQIEDLDVSREESDEVKGGFSWGVTQGAAGGGAWRPTENLSLNFGKV
jgi:hypothetical protein